MNNIYHRILKMSLLSICLLFSAHAKSEVSEKKQLANSLKKWQMANKLCKGNYSYQVKWQSFVGFGHTTTLTIKNNTVIERRYESFSEALPPNEEHKITDSWVEKEKQVGSHKAGFPPFTIDELYAQAQKIVSLPLKKFMARYVGFNKSGLLSHAFWLDTRIMDDSPRNGVPSIEINIDPACIKK